MKEEIYLGDGLYASFDGESFWLRAPRKNGDHIVALEPDVLEAFWNYVQTIRERVQAEPTGFPYSSRIQ